MFKIKTPIMSAKECRSCENKGKEIRLYDGQYYSFCNECSLYGASEDPRYKNNYCEKRRG